MKWRIILTALKVLVFGGRWCPCYSEFRKLLSPTLAVAGNPKFLMNAGVLQVVVILRHQPLFKYIHAHMPLMHIGHKNWSSVHLWKPICGKLELGWYHHSQEGLWLNSNIKVKPRMLWHTKCAVLLYAIFCSTPHGIDLPHIECLAVPLFRCSLKNWVLHPDNIW